MYTRFSYKAITLFFSVTSLQCLQGVDSPSLRRNKVVDLAQVVQAVQLLPHDAQSPDPFLNRSLFMPDVTSKKAEIMAVGQHLLLASGHQEAFCAFVLKTCPNYGFNLEDVRTVLAQHKKDADPKKVAFLASLLEN